MCRKESCHENPQGSVLANKSDSMSMTSPASGTVVSLYCSSYCFHLQIFCVPTRDSPKHCILQTELPNSEKWNMDP